MKEYTLRVPEDTIGFSITILSGKKRLFAKNYNINSMATHIVDLLQLEESEDDGGHI